VSGACVPHSPYIARLALDAETRRDAFRLRYESYRDQGYIEPNQTGMFEDRYDDLDNSRIVVVYDHRGAIGSVRLCLLNTPGAASPAMESFPGELARLLDQIGVGSVAAEITRLVRSPAAADDAGLVFLLYRLANYVGYFERVALLLASVRRNHAVFYRRLGFAIETEPRPYPGLTCLMQLLSCDRAAYERSFQRFPLIAPFASGSTPLDGLLCGHPVEVSFPSQRSVAATVQ
jgi:hypothetical protein